MIGGVDQILYSVACQLKSPDWKAVAKRLGLSDRQVRHITENCCTNLRQQPYQALLQWRRAREEATVVELVQALRDSGQDTLSEYIQRTYLAPNANQDANMSVAYRQIIFMNRPTLEREVRVDPVVDYLAEKGTLAQAQQSELRRIGTSRGRLLRLLDMLPVLGDQAFHDFCDAVRHGAGQPDLAAVLERPAEKVKVPRVPPIDMTEMQTEESEEDSFRSTPEPIRPMIITNGIRPRKGEPVQVSKLGHAVTLKCKFYLNPHLPPRITWLKGRKLSTATIIFDGFFYRSNAPYSPREFTQAFGEYEQRLRLDEREFPAITLYHVGPEDADRYWCRVSAKRTITGSVVLQCSDDPETVARQTPRENSPVPLRVTPRSRSGSPPQGYAFNERDRWIQTADETYLNRRRFADQLC
uniref:Death domain-containing protein n=1 Tax=Branchiostoma floridae TaxID=7739 RepID=C3Z7R0_BRAFL|eukprot:XP_002595403.1 hypothetical protein BRAFLDRAFT_69233 [Branchiostoma floridae]